MPTDRLRRSTAACGVAYFVLLLTNLTMTAEGPNHMEPLGSELARVQAHALALRWSALLGVLGALAFAGLAIGLALVLAGRGRRTAAVVSASAAIATVAVWTVSFAALAASSVASETGLGADAVMGLGILHTTTFLMAFAPAGVLVLAVATTDLFGRVGRPLSILVGACAVYSAVLILPLAEEQSSFGAPLVIAFQGIPFWSLGVAFRLLRPRSAAPLATG